MKRKIAKTLSLILVASMLFALPVCADTVLTEAGTASVEVNANISSAFEVQVPDAVTLSEEDTPVDIYVSGNISGEEVLWIVTDETLTMSSDGKEDVTLNITQNQQNYAHNEIETQATSTATIDAISEEMTAGAWSGEIL